MQTRCPVRTELCKYLVDMRVTLSKPTSIKCKIYSERREKTRAEFQGGKEKTLKG